MPILNGVSGKYKQLIHILETSSQVEKIWRFLTGGVYKEGRIFCFLLNIGKVQLR